MSSQKPINDKTEFREKNHCSNAANLTLIRLTMTRAMCSRISKRKQIKPSQDVIPEDCKENSPLITSQRGKYKKQVNLSTNATISQENIAVGNKLQNSVSSKKEEGCLRKSERHRKSTFKLKDFIYNVPKGEIKIDTLAKRNVLSDKTNSPISRGTKINTKSEPLQTTLNKSKNVAIAINACQPNDIFTDKCNIKSHIPVYKTIDPSDVPYTTSSLPSEKKEAVYDFDEVDENEEPVQKKKKKKRTNVRKPKMGPKALTINNIKYSSTESLVSLPEKAVKQKKTKTKKETSCIKPYTSINNLNDSQVTCYSVQSFMSHPTSLLLHDKKELHNKRELSVLQETQSENCPSPVHETSDRISTVENQSEIMDSCHQRSNTSTILPNASSAFQNNSTVSQQRCYPSKKSLSNFNVNETSCCSSRNDTLPKQVGINHCSGNISLGSSHDFLSSTPCKRASLVVRHNSVFSDSCERDITNRLRPSTGFINDIEASENMVIDEKYFGFDEPEELEEPLVSPIKNINLQEPRLPHWRQNPFSSCNEIENSKPNVKEVIEKLKSSIPKAQTKETSDVFNSDSSSTDCSNTSSPISKEVETTLNFTKPPRRSYERQRRNRHCSEREVDDDEDEEEENVENADSLQKQTKHGKQGNVLKPPNKCYQKKNLTKVFKPPQISKAKQRILKEEEELERLAAQMNAQFQEIEKCNLVVE